MYSCLCKLTDSTRARLELEKNLTGGFNGSQSSYPSHSYGTGRPLDVVHAVST